MKETRNNDKMKAEENDLLFLPGIRSRVNPELLLAWAPLGNWTIPGDTQTASFLEQCQGWKSGSAPVYTWCSSMLELGSRPKSGLLVTEANHSIWKETSISSLLRLNFYRRSRYKFCVDEFYWLWSLYRISSTEASKYVSRHIGRNVEQMSHCTN